MNRLITFEGIDGSGKSTQIKLLESWFTENGNDFISVREPGGTSISEDIRSILLDKSNRHLGEATESFLFLSARAQLVREIITPALRNDQFVICDRFIDSTIAYQGYGRRLDVPTLKVLNDFAIGVCIPGISFILDIPVDTSYNRRLDTENDRMEAAGNSFMERVRMGYKDISESEPERVTLLDGTGTKEALFQKIKACLSKNFEELE